MTLKLEVGKTYRTRGGFEATVCDRVAGAKVLFVGACWCGDRLPPGFICWNEDGNMVTSEKPTDYDLVSEAIVPSSAQKESVPKQAQDIDPLRFQAACAAMQSMMMISRNASAESIAISATEHADALLERLRK